MNNKSYRRLLPFFLFSFILVAASCMDGDYDEVDFSQAPYGNNALAETNVVSIGQLKQMYKKAFTTDYRDGKAFQLVEENLQIKGFVTGNDITGNLYNEVAIEDETGAIIVAIQSGGLNGYLAVGTEILIELKGLYVGNYGKQAEIGMPYTNNRGQTYVSRMNKMLWQEHFKLTGNHKNIEPKLFAEGSNKTSWNLDVDDGRLGIIKNVSLKGVNPNSLYADPAKKQSVSYYFKEQGNTVMIYTSPYCDFAARTVPQGKVNITGIVKRFNNSWELIIRSLDDVEELK